MNKEYMQVYRTKVRQEAYKILGGKCKVCGSTEKLEFDHVDPASKSFHIASNWTRARKDLFQELQKCQLLCKKHHTEKSLAEGSFNHIPWNKGVRSHGISGYNFGCRCDICRLAKKTHRAKYPRGRYARG